MLRYEHTLAQLDSARLMDLAAALREFTARMSALAGLPKFLAETLDLEALTFALVKTTGGPDQRGQILTSGSFNRTPSATPGEAEGAGSTGEKQQAILDLAMGAGHDCDHDEIPTCRCRQMVLARQVDTQHRMLLLINQPPDKAGLTGPTLETLHLVANHLAKALGAMLHLQDYPPRIGEPFERLTEREWMVLCGLDSDDGEKQLADRLNLSPHTLHSHIKAIYRKTGVQGRLPLLQHFHRALAEYRVRILQPAKQESATDRAVG